jgi:hypothetical protein
MEKLPSFSHLSKNSRDQSGQSLQGACKCLLTKTQPTKVAPTEQSHHHSAGDDKYSKNTQDHLEWVECHYGGVAAGGGNDKVLYRKAVIENYGDSIPEQPCTCDPNPPNATTRQLDETRDPNVPVWPFEGLPFPEGTLEWVLCRITWEQLSTGDMDMNQLVRALYFTTDETDRAKIINALQSLYDAGELPFWLQPREMHW